MRENNFETHSLFLRVETDFLACGNHFLLLPQIYVKSSFILDSGNPFFSPKEEVFFYSEFSFLQVESIIQIIENPV